MATSPLKIGIVGIPGKWSTEVLADAIKKRTGFRLVIDIQQVTAELSTQKVHYKKHNLCELDAIIVKKISSHYCPTMMDRIEILRFVESCGVRVFSKPENIYRTVNRLSGTITLMNGKIPMPPTTLTENIDAALKAVKTYEQAILKPMFSTKAQGMTVLNAKNSSKVLRQQLKNFKKQHGYFYIQKRLKLPGHDLALIFLGGEYQGAYARLSGGKSWNTTIQAGGQYAPAQPSDEMIAVASKASKLFGLDFTTVDMAETKSGFVCFEVSAFGGFRGAKEGLGLDMAQAYADYVIEKMKN